MFWNTISMLMNQRQPHSKNDLLVRYSYFLYDDSLLCTADVSNGFAGRFLGFSVYVSNTTKKEDGVLCFRDTNYTTVTIPNPVDISCPYHGRYVIYYNNRTHQPYHGGFFVSWGVFYLRPHWTLWSEGQR